jgi:hypothetical protein
MFSVDVDSHQGCTHEHPSPPPPPAGAALASNRRAWSQPVVAGVLGLGACVLLALRDPNASGSYGFCPFKVATGGLDCPGCGMMRGTHALLRGDVGRALDHNIFLPLVLVTILIGYVRWTRRSVGHEVAPVTPPAWAVIAAAVLICGFWVARNVGGPLAYLDSEAT